MNICWKILPTYVPEMRLHLSWDTCMIVENTWTYVLEMKLHLSSDQVAYRLKFTASIPQQGRHRKIDS